MLKFTMSFIYRLYNNTHKIIFSKRKPIFQLAMITKIVTNYIIRVKIFYS